jgi:hypothetical protein
LTTVYYHSKQLGLAKENQLKAIKYFDYYCKVKNLKKSEAVHDRLKFKHKQLVREINRPAEQQQQIDDSRSERNPSPERSDKKAIPQNHSEEASEKLSKMSIQNHEFTPKNSSRQMDESVKDHIDEMVETYETKRVTNEFDESRNIAKRASTESVRKGLTDKELTDRYDEAKSNIRIVDKDSTADLATRSNDDTMTNRSREETGENNATLAEIDNEKDDTDSKTKYENVDKVRHQVLNREVTDENMLDMFQEEIKKRM